MRDPVFTVVMAIILALLLVVALAILTSKPNNRQVISSIGVSGFSKD